MSDIPLKDMLSLSLQGDTLADFVELLPCSAHLRDVKKDKYLLANKYQAYNNGFNQIQTVLDSSSKDLWYNYGALHARLNASIVQADRMMKRFNKAIYQATVLQKVNSFQEEWLLHDGSVYVGINQKFPILGGPTRKTVAIFTVSREITRRTNLFELYGYYKQTYPLELAIQHFLRYLKLAKYFVATTPTDNEILVLIAMHQATSHAFASGLIKTKTQTIVPKESIPSHLEGLSSKLKNGYDAGDLVLKLRKHAARSRTVDSKVVDLKK